MDEFTKFNKFGHVCPDQRLVPKALLNLARTAVDDINQGVFHTGRSPWSSIDVGNPRRLQRSTQVHMSNKNIADLVTATKLGEVAAYITGSTTIKLWGSQLFFKPSQSGMGGNIGFHRDSQHVPYFSKGMLVVWIPLHDITLKNGPITYLSGSHKWNQNILFSGGDFQNLHMQKQRIKTHNDLGEWTESVQEMKAGQVSFHHMDTLHGSPENISDNARYAISFGLLTDQAEFDSSEEDFGYASVLENEEYCPKIYG